MPGAATASAESPGRSPPLAVTNDGVRRCRWPPRPSQAGSGCQHRAELGVPGGSLGRQTGGHSMIGAVWKLGLRSKLRKRLEI